MSIARPAKQHIEVRQLDTEDLAHFGALLTLFAEVFEEARTPLAPHYMRMLLSDAGLVVLVALAGEEVVGGATMRLWDAYTAETRHAYLYDLAVRESHRRQGIATSLISACCACATARGVSALWVEAETEDEHAVRFYRSLGAMELDVRHFELLQEAS